MYTIELYLEPSLRVRDETVEYARQFFDVLFPGCESRNTGTGYVQILYQIDMSKNVSVAAEKLADAVMWMDKFAGQDLGSIPFKVSNGNIYDSEKHVAAVGKYVGSPIVRDLIAYLAAALEEKRQLTAAGGGPSGQS